LVTKELARSDSASICHCGYNDDISKNIEALIFYLFGAADAAGSNRLANSFSSIQSRSSLPSGSATRRIYLIGTDFLVGLFMS